MPDQCRRLRRLRQCDCLPYANEAIHAHGAGNCFNRALLTRERLLLAWTTAHRSISVGDSVNLGSKKGRELGLNSSVASSRSCRRTAVATARIAAVGIIPIVIGLLIRQL